MGDIYAWGTGLWGFSRTWECVSCSEWSEIPECICTVWICTRYLCCAAPRVSVLDQRLCETGEIPTKVPKLTGITFDGFSGAGDFVAAVSREGTVDFIQGSNASRSGSVESDKLGYVLPLLPSSPLQRTPPCKPASLCIVVWLCWPCMQFLHD